MFADMVVFSHMPRIKQRDGALPKRLVDELHVVQRTANTAAATYIERQSEVLAWIAHFELIVGDHLIGGKPRAMEIFARAHRQFAPKQREPASIKFCRLGVI